MSIPAINRFNSMMAPHFGLRQWDDRDFDFGQAVRDGKVMAWDVDTQKTFVFPVETDAQGRRRGLPVPGAEEILPVFARVVGWLKDHLIPRVATMDTHAENDVEFPIFTAISDRHAVQGEPDWDKLDETDLGNNPLVIGETPNNNDVPDTATLKDAFANGRTVVLRKDYYSPIWTRVAPPDADGADTNLVPNWKGRKLFDELKELGYQYVLVFGLATDFCVEAAVKAIKQMGLQPIVIQDAMKSVFPTDKLENPDDPVYGDVLGLTSDQLGEELQAARG